MITRSGLADEIDGFDVQIKALNDAKSAAYKAYREQLEDAGMEPRRASAEVAATKAAIVKRRKLRENPDAAREKDDMIDAILVEIMERPSRAREASQSYAEQKGRGDVDARLVATVTAGVQTEIGRKALLVAVDAMIEAEEAGITEHEQPETATKSLANGPCDAATERPATLVEAKASAESGVAGEPASIPDAADRDAGKMPTCALTPRDDLTVGTHSNPPAPGRSQALADKTETVSSHSVSVALSDDGFDPSELSFLRKDKPEPEPSEKSGCLKLKDGHCRISFETPALCSDCNNARMKARAA